MLERDLRQSQKMEAVGQLAGGVAHDFNDLLLAILMNCDFGLEEAKEEAIVRSLTEIKAAAQRAAELTKQLLAFSRIQAFDHRLVDLNACAGMMEMLRRLLPATIEIEFVPGKNLSSVKADESQLEQVILNLCINARDAMKEGGRLTLRTENVKLGRGTVAKPGDHVMLEVADNGEGMTRAVQERIFEPFFTTKPHGEGTGLGLSTVYGIVKQHGGLVKVFSEPSVGTTFKVYLPADNRPVTGSEASGGGHARGGTEKVLVAEDSEPVRAAVRRLLERAGYSVVIAENGKEAVERIEREEGIDLVLLDVVMPEMGGPEACRRIQAASPKTKILFTSGYSETALFTSAGIDRAQVVGKPYIPDELLRRIRKLLEED